VCRLSLPCGGGSGVRLSAAILNHFIAVKKTAESSQPKKFRKYTQKNNNPGKKSLLLPVARVTMKILVACVLIFHLFF